MIDSGTDGGIVTGMNTQNPKWIATAQTIFYSAATLIIPQIVSALGAGGALSAMLPAWVTNYGIAGAIIVVLNYYDNKINARNLGSTAMFGMINA